MIRDFYGRVALLALAIVLSACSAPAPAASTASAPPSPSAALATGTAPPAAGDLTKVRVGALRSGADAGLYVAMAKGYFEQEHISIDLTEFANAGEIIPPLASGQLEVGGGGISPALFNAYNRGIPIKLVADRVTYAAGTSYVSYLVRKGLVDQIHTPADMRGRTIAINGRGGSSEINVERMLAQGGLTIADVNLVELSWPDMVPAFASGAIDVGNIAEPSATLAISQGVASRWRGAEEFYPDDVVGVLQYAEQFMRAEPDVAQGFMVAYLKGVRDYNDAFMKHRDRQTVVNILTQYTSVKDPKLWETMQVPHINPNGVIVRSSLQTDQEWYLAHGLIQKLVPLDDIIDESYARNAVRILGEYT